MKQANTDLFDSLLEEATADELILSRLSFNVTTRLLELMNRIGIKQKDLATKLGKSEAEISKWLTGMHNFTLKTISKLEAVLDDTILETPGCRPTHSLKNWSVLVEHQSIVKTSRAADVTRPSTHTCTKTVAPCTRPAFVRVPKYERSNLTIAQ